MNETITCEICKRDDFKNNTSLVSHLTHSKSTCKIKIKDYYDTYLRKSDEGICINCKKETGFSGINVGYHSGYCTKCKQFNPETIKKQIESRNKTYEKRNIIKEQKKIESGYYKRPEFCEICKEQGNDIRFLRKSGIAKHLIVHNVKPKDYYDKYFKKEGEGICPITGKNTRFKTMEKGYYKYFGKGSCSKDDKVKKKKVEKLLENYGVTNAASANEENRIKSYKKTCDKNRQLKHQRWLFISLLRKMTIDKEDKNQCQICGVKYKKFRSLSKHIHKGHKILIKDYYDKYVKKEGEGICLVSGLETTFSSLESGYLRFHKNYQQKSEEVKKLMREMKFKLHGDEWYNNTEKNLKTKEERYGFKGYNNHEQTSKTKQERYNDPNYNNREKYIETMIEKCGGIEEYKKWRLVLIELCQEGMLRNHGVKHGLQIEGIFDVINKTWDEKYDGHPMTSPDVVEKISGPNHYNWNPNRNEIYEPYTEKFYDKDFRKLIIEDQCGLDPVTGNLLIKRAALHHIDHNKLNDSRENLIYLNIDIHISIHMKNQEFWKEELKKINMKIITKK